MKKLILLLASLCSCFAYSEPVSPSDLTVSFDEVTIAEGKLAFERESGDLRPSLSEFQLSYCRFLSNDLGERFALVTLAKEAGIRRIVDTRDIVGVLASGERLFPISIEGETHIGRRGTVLLHFGSHKFPLVGVEVRND